jgi:hypothetical protein
MEKSARISLIVPELKIIIIKGAIRAIWYLTIIYKNYMYINSANPNISYRIHFNTVINFFNSSTFHLM